VLANLFHARMINALFCAVKRTEGKNLNNFEKGKQQ